MKKTFILSAVLLIGVLSLSACNLPQPAEQATEAPNAVFTAAAQTVEAQLTQSALINPPTPMPVIPTNTVPPANTTIPPTNTLIPPTATATQVCDQARFISDVTVKDGTEFAPNDTFEKVWRLRNDGACTWSTSYQLVFDSGDAMNGPSAIPLPGTVAPGQEIDFKVTLKAPAAAGGYRGYWRIRNAAGVYLPVFNGYQGKSFYVDIKVQAPGSVEVYNFVSKYCDAVWNSSEDALTCPGANTDSQGFIIRIDTPKLETGVTEDEAAIETHPAWLENTWISGLYPAIEMKSGYRFRAILGCLHGAAACDVNFQLNVYEGGAKTNIGSWHQVYDNSVINVDLDLGAWAGKTLKFELVVESNGASGQDWAIWLQPRIVK
jgi:hypothetical protein